MNITKKIAILRFMYHMDMLYGCNIANKVGILNDDKAKRVIKKHKMQAMNCLQKLGCKLQ